MLGRRRDTGPVVAEVVEVGAEQHRFDPQTRGQRRGVFHQLGLAHRASVARVGREAGALELVGVHDMVALAETELLTQRARVIDLRPRHRDRNARDRVARIAERARGYSEQERGVHAAGERDQRATVSADDLAQPRELYILHILRNHALHASTKPA